MSDKKENDFLHISCLIDLLKNGKDSEMQKAAEVISVATSMNDVIETEGDTIQSNLPNCIQYTHGIGSFAQQLAQHNFRTAILFDSQEAIDFTTELLEDKKEQSCYLMLIEESLSVEEKAFPMSPDGNGWKTVILDDILPFVGADSDLISLLRAIASTMIDGGKLILRIEQFKNKDSWSKEFNDTVVTESIEKLSIRKFTRTFTSHGALNLRHKENIHSFDSSDLHECARQASFRPTRELGLDPLVWCCYEKV